jgi:GNAT superfamily N-acetyltransferase
LVELRVGNDLDLDEFIEVYEDSGLAHRRPAGDRERMRAMLANANLVVTAWEDGRIVGLARSLSDFSFATYVSDLAVRRSHQRQGIGRALLARVQQEGGPARVILLAAPNAKDYYPQLGMQRHNSAWTLDEVLLP